MVQLPEWARKPLSQMTDEDTTAWDTWEPTKEEALAVSDAACQRMLESMGITGATRVEPADSEQ